MTHVAASLEYRAYLMDASGHIDDVRLIHANDDSAAWKIALSFKLEAALELWCRDREVPQFAA